ncbi:MAG: hypothetical protein P1U86_06555 [Verrucomicrobiales bacterium]|nr:hypothetical protein [Verrucomicrobiales bacterium]
MSERPPIQATGRITKVHTEGRLFEVTMPNGYTAYGILEKKGPPLPEGAAPLDCEVTVLYSAYDMSKCKILDWKVLTPV